MPRTTTTSATAASTRNAREATARMPRRDASVPSTDPVPADSSSTVPSLRSERRVIPSAEELTEPRGDGDGVGARRRRGADGSGGVAERIRTRQRAAERIPARTHRDGPAVGARDLHGHALRAEPLGERVVVEHAHERGGGGRPVGQPVLDLLPQLRAEDRLHRERQRHEEHREEREHGEDRAGAEGPGAQRRVGPGGGSAAVREAPRAGDRAHASTR
ncbi:hypothetical protein [Clavibacter tessellarius]|uniref:hypothetical protein n=1 Tax=Clavibacter tessellarius TaxID=31965 RepID=UPI003251775C